MKIAKGNVVGIDYSLHLGDGQVVDASDPGEPLTYLHGEGQIAPGLESALDGLDVGDSRKIVVQPAEGYGEHDPEGDPGGPARRLPARVRAAGRDGAHGGGPRRPSGAVHHPRGEARTR